ncbi:MAG: hypothetical protein E7H33_08915 [Clostridium perfringens]|nr:hypothetical protein [Clostridium perfringens]
MKIKNYSLFGGLFVNNIKFSINFILFAVGFQMISDDIIKILEVIFR